MSALPLQQGKSYMPFPGLFKKRREKAVLFIIVIVFFRHEDISSQIFTPFYCLIGHRPYQDLFQNEEHNSLLMPFLLPS